MISKTDADRLALMHQQGHKLTEQEISNLAEFEAHADEKKDFLELLSNVHSELLNQDGNTLAHLTHAQKRLASLTAKAARSADKASEENAKLQGELKTLSIRVLVLSWIVAGLTLISTWASCSQAYYARRADQRATNAPEAKPQR